MHLSPYYIVMRLVNIDMIYLEGNLQIFRTANTEMLIASYYHAHTVSILVM
jgi:hypothetical protein